MATRAQKVRLSIFLIISSSILLMFFLALVGGRFFRRMDTYYIDYQNVSVTGLEPGAAVKYHGVQIGRVVTLTVKDPETVRVEIEVREGTPIKTDTEAVLTLVGITGLKFVELLGGSSESPMLEKDGVIVAGTSLFDALSGKAEIMLIKVEQVLNNIVAMTGPETTARVNRTLDNIDSITASADSILTGNRDHIGNTIAQADTLLQYMASTTATLREAAKRFNTIVQSGKIDQIVDNTAAVSEMVRGELDTLEVAETLANLNALIVNANEMVAHYDLMGLRARDDVLNSLTNLEETLNNLREATDIIRENPSVLLRGRQSTTDRIE